MRAYRLRKKLAAGLAPPPRVIAKGIPLGKTPNLIDTTGWNWYDWCRKYEDIKILKHQEENLDHMSSTEIHKMALNDPRQYGKTTYCAKPFITRVMCESVFRNHDLPVFYTTHSKDGAEAMVMDVRDDLIRNDEILDNYGEVLDLSVVKRMRLLKQTQQVLNLKNKRTRSHSLLGVSMGSGIRGITAKKVVIDDPIDLEDEENYYKATVKFLGWLRKKVMPIARGGQIFLMGTRYNVSDLWAVLKVDKVWKIIKRQVVREILPYKVNPPAGREVRPKDIQAENESEWDVLAPELWKHGGGTVVQNILYALVSQGDQAFQQEMMNNPIPMKPVIDWNWLKEYDANILPTDNPDHMQLGVFVDTASGQSEKADYNAFVFGFYYKRQFYIADIWHGKLTPLKKVKELETFIQDNADILDTDRTNIQAMIEVVRDQDFINLVKEHSWIAPNPPGGVNPRGRGLKPTRIRNNLGAEMEADRVSIARDCRRKRKFRWEIEGFPYSKHEHIMDAADQLLHTFKNSASPFAGVKPRSISSFTSPVKSW